MDSLLRATVQWWQHPCPCCRMLLLLWGLRGVTGEAAAAVGRVRGGRDDE